MARVMNGTAKCHLRAPRIRARELTKRPISPVAAPPDEPGIPGSLTMGIVGQLDAISSAPLAREVSATRRAARWVTGCEVIAVFTGILLYIWRWQSTHPLFWIPLLGFIIVSQVIHHDSAADMGLALRGLRGSAEIILPLAAAIYLPVVIFALATHRLELLSPGGAALRRFAGYGVWCCFQEYLVQCYFHRRLMTIVSKPHVSSALVALMFGAAHIPNPVLIAATVLGGFILAEVYARHPNIWPLALAQTAGGLLIAALVPGSVIHNMRVGPGYFSYRG